MKMTKQILILIQIQISVKLGRLLPRLEVKLPVFHRFFQWGETLYLLCEAELKNNRLLSVKKPHSNLTSNNCELIAYL